MYKLNIKIEGAKEVADMIGRKAREISPVINKALNDSKAEILGILRDNTPVDTGRLRDSNRVTIQKNRLIIGPDLRKAYYAPFVEFGHTLPNGAFLPGQYFVKRSIKEIDLTVGYAIEEQINNLVKK